MSEEKVPYETNTGVMPSFAVGTETEDVGNLEKELHDYMRRPTYVSQLVKANKERPAVFHDPMSFTHEVLEHWYLYMFLIISSVFTGTLGFYLGTAPTRLENGDLYFHTDVAHIFLAFVYMISFVSITEFAFALAKRLYYTRESKNQTQMLVMLAMMIVAGVSILGTGVAGGIVVASTVDFLTAFVAVPVWAQYWVVRIIPALFVLYSVLISVYVLASNKAETYRLIRERDLEHSLDIQARSATLSQWANEEIEKAASLRYIALVKQGLMSVADARAAMSAESSLSMPERKKINPTNGGR